MQFVFDKEEWKQDAFTRIKQSLYYAKGNTVAGRYSNAQEEHLVVVYGITQVGKTTLILNMIGIQEQYFDTVYKTLRAGQPTGSSSTSTAIIYSISDSDNYKLAIRKMNAVDFSDMKEYDDNDLITHLKQIREDVESGRFDPADILYIAIPKMYFESDAKDSKISIIDLPGDHSKNCEEMIHVSNLLSRYIPIASTCIIATRSGWIEQLGALDLPNKVSWKNMNHRFVIVVTHAYSDADTKSFFIKHKSHSREDFYHFVQDRNESAIRKILGSNNKTYVFPVELGDSLSTLRKEFSSSESVISAINFAKNTTLNQLRQSILNRKGQRLQAAIADLRVIIDTNHRAMTELLSSTIKDLTAEINRLNQRAIQIEGLINTLDFQIRECNNNSDTKSIKQKISQLNATIISLDVDGWWHDIDTYYQEHKWYSKHPTRLNFWKREEACNYFYTYIIDRISDYIKLQFDKLISANSVETVIIDHQSRMRKKVFHVGECSWESKPEQLLECMKELATIICDSIQANVDKAIFDLEEVLKGNMQQKQVWANFKKLQEKDLEETRAKIVLCDAKIRHYNNELSTLELRKHDDIITLEHYLDIAKQAYHNYRNRMISLINRNDTTPEEKIKLLLYIGTLDKDYKKIAGGTE